MICVQGPWETKMLLALKNVLTYVIFLGPYMCGDKCNCALVLLWTVCVGLLLNCVHMHVAVCISEGAPTDAPAKDADGEEVDSDDEFA